MSWTFKLSSKAKVGCTAAVTAELVSYHGLINMRTKAGLCLSRHHVVQALLEHATASNISVSLRCQHPGDAQMDTSTSLLNMQQSKFCLMMPGVHHATARLSEAILAGMSGGMPGASCPPC